MTIDPQNLLERLIACPSVTPEVAGVVFVEHGAGSGAATPIVKHVMDTYFAKKEGRPLPKLAPPTPPTTPTTSVGGATQR